MKPEKTDVSPKIYQRDKIKDKLTIKEINWTDKQKELLQIATDKNTRIVFLSGPAGTSKSYCAVYSALKLLNEKKVSDIIYIRSAVESSDSKLGYLPGTENDKMKLYGLPFFDKLHELLPSMEVKALVDDQRVFVHPTNFVRGMSWNAKVLIFDEAQNSSMKEIITVITRLGKFAKCFVLADTKQTDLKNGNCGGFEKIYSTFDTPQAREQGIVSFKFTSKDIVRDPLVRFIVEELEKVNL